MKRLRFIPALLIALLLLISSCTKQTCPTYAEGTEPQDSAQYKFSNAEKAGGVLFLLFAIYATQHSK